MKFSERLTELMAEKGLNKLSLAKEIGVSDRVVGSWVKEENAPKLESAIALAEFFGVPLDYLAGRSDCKSVTPGPGALPAPALEGEEAELISLWERLSGADRAAVKYDMYRRLGEVSE